MANESGHSSPDGYFKPSYWLFGTVLVVACWFIPNPIAKVFRRLLCCSGENRQDQILDINDLFARKLNEEEREPIPIVYNSNYDVKIWGFLRQLHPFDSAKWGRIHSKLNEFFEAQGKNVTTISPIRPIADQELNLVHTNRFLELINTSPSFVAQAAEMPLFHLIPTSFLKRMVLEPMRWQVSGSILAANEALKRKRWAINIGGGFHHASTHKAEGFCFFADITLIMKVLWKRNPNYKFMVVDLDAHQGNGYARDICIKKTDVQDKVYIVDFYNPNIYPKDTIAAKFIKKNVPIHDDVEDEGYLNLLNLYLNEALDEFTPDLIIYNAGTDCLINDPLGKMSLTKEGIIKRDEFVFRIARDREIPIVLLTSGGYQPVTADVVTDSIINLFRAKIIS